MQKFSLISLSCLALLAACGSEPEAPEIGETPAETPDPAIAAAVTAEGQALAGCGPVTVEGYCGVRFGMTEEAASAAFPVKLENYDIAPPGRPDPARCFELFAVEPVRGFSLLIEGGGVRRIDFLSETARTADGLGVGSTLAAVRAKFGAAVTETPNVFEPEIIDLGVMQGETKFVFEMQDNMVRSWRVGQAPAIDYSAHCG